MAPEKYPPKVILAGRTKIATKYASFKDRPCPLCAAPVKEGEDIAWLKGDTAPVSHWRCWEAKNAPKPVGLDTKVSEVHLQSSPAPQNYYGAPRKADFFHVEVEFKGDLDRFEPEFRVYCHYTHEMTEEGEARALKEVEMQNRTALLASNAWVNVRDRSLQTVADLRLRALKSGGDK